MTFTLSGTTKEEIGRKLSVKRIKAKNQLSLKMYISLYWPNGRPKQVSHYQGIPQYKSYR